MNRWGASLIAAVIVLLLSRPWPASAAERCKAQINPSSREVAVSATGVAPNPRWGTAQGGA